MFRDFFGTGFKKCQSSTSPRLKKSRLSRSKGKTLFDYKDIIHHAPPGQIVNKPYCRNIMLNLRNTVHRERTECTRTKRLSIQRSLCLKFWPSTIFLRFDNHNIPQISPPVASSPFEKSSPTWNLRENPREATRELLGISKKVFQKCFHQRK